MMLNNLKGKVLSVKGKTENLNSVVLSPFPLSPCSYFTLPLYQQIEESKSLDKAIKKNLEVLGYGE